MNCYRIIFNGNTELGIYARGMAAVMRELKKMVIGNVIPLVPIVSIAQIGTTIPAERQVQYSNGL